MAFNKSKSILLLLCLITLISSSCDKKTTDPEPEPLGSNSIMGTNNTIATILNTTEIDKDLKESSSLEISIDGTHWTANDHGNSPILYGFNLNGDIEQEIEILGVDNNDWEDLALDENDNLYVGDFGNNDNDRTDLAIYKIPNFSTVTTAGVNSEIIQFNLEDQTAFPPSDENMQFDVEAITAYQNSLYLFTKDRSKPFVGLTKLYQLSTEAGTQEAQLLATFSTSSIEEKGAITSADLSPDGTKLVLLSEQTIYLFTNFQIPNFFSGDLETFDLPIEKQFEGITFKGNCALHLTNEKKYGEDQSLTTISLCN